MAAWKFFLITPRHQEFQDVVNTINEAASLTAQDASHRIEFVRTYAGPGSRSDDIHVRQALDKVSVVVADATGADPNVLFVLGVAEASGKPIIVLHQEDELVPSALVGHRVLLYDRSRLHTDLLPRLRRAIVDVLGDAQDDTERGWQEETQTIPRAFISYSHTDKEALDRLLVHLKPLQRQGVLDVWADTMIKAGDRWEEEISAALSRAVIAVLLISADFMASDFIIDNELPPLLEGARERGTRILPVVLKPCRFERDANLSQFQSVNPPSEPVLLLSPGEQERVWDKVAYAIETEIGDGAT